MTTPRRDELLTLIDHWASHFGYYDGKIDLDNNSDLSAFTTPDCAMTAHAPLWRTKEGEEKAIDAGEVQKTLAGMLKWTRVGRHQMHMALHPERPSLCLFFVLKARPFFLPFNVMTVPLAFVVDAVDTDDGLRIREIHEWPATSPQDARRVLVDTCSWPSNTTLAPHVAFGAVS